MSKILAPLLKTGTVRKVSLRLVSLRNVISPREMEMTKDLDLFRTSMILFAPKGRAEKSHECAGQKKIIAGTRGAKKDTSEDLVSHLNDFFAP